jgi:hypothetical protein
VAVLNGGSEVSPPSTRRSMKLLGHEQSLLELGVVHKPKLILDDAKLVIRLQRINCLSNHGRVHHQEVSVGSLHPWLAVGRAHITLHEVLRQHPHELVLHGQWLLEAHGQWWWQWWWGSPMSNIAKLIHRCPSTNV